VLLTSALTVPAFAQQGTLKVVSIDVEGGGGTLFVTPEGKSLLIDTGWPGFNGRDADRIVAAAKLAGLKKLDFVLVTHYHRDHVGGFEVHLAPDLGGERVHQPRVAAAVPVWTGIGHTGDRSVADEVAASLSRLDPEAALSNPALIDPKNSGASWRRLAVC
jgi:glyoxylase-like metal-dependent hydrolase (beta-lactamase superfamily II)